MNVCEQTKLSAAALTFMSVRYGTVTKRENRNKLDTF
jgi:hypothetical protein